MKPKTKNIKKKRPESNSNTPSVNENKVSYFTLNSNEDLNSWKTILDDMSQPQRIVFPSTMLATSGAVNFHNDSTYIDQLKLSDEIHILRKNLGEMYKKLEEAKGSKRSALQKFNKLQEELHSKEGISHILPRISEKGRNKLFRSSDFKAKFQNATTCEAVVISIDIRKSTELMLKARSAELYASFITLLTKKLSDIIINNYGIFDKFTGDGILAFFPDFYSGKDAIVHAIKAAQQCHEIFHEHYRESKSCFNVFIKDVGLGIGMDFGPVTIVNNSSELTVVGIPVVYACRMSGATAGNTFLNQPAFEYLTKNYGDYVSYKEAELNIKNEGTALAYLVNINDKPLKIDEPNWDGFK